jgi:hypothetical protein
MTNTDIISELNDYARHATWLRSKRGDVNYRKWCQSFRDKVKRPMVTRLRGYCAKGLERRTFYLVRMFRAQSVENKGKVIK